LYELCFIISAKRDDKLYFYINDLYNKINAYPSIRYYTNYKYKVLKAIPFGDGIPDFGLIGALAIIATVVNNIDGQLDIIATINISPDEKLIALQTAKDSLDTILTDNASCANNSANIINHAPLPKDESLYREYPLRHANTTQFYESPE